MPTSKAPEAPRLSVVIVTFNAGKLLRACLSSIAAHPPRDSYEVIVYDNASADDTLPATETRVKPTVRNMPRICLPRISVMYMAR